MLSEFGFGNVNSTPIKNLKAGERRAKMGETEKKS